MPVKDSICLWCGFSMMFKSQSSGVCPSSPNQGCPHASVSMRLSISFTERAFPPGEPQRFLLICFQRKTAILLNQSARAPLPMFTRYLFTWWILAPETKAADTIINHRNYVSSCLRLFIYQHTHTTYCVTLSETQGSSEPAMVHVPETDICTVF